MRTLIIGLDAFDPNIFERLVDKGRLPHFSKYVKSKGYSRFAISNPPQSEVSWTSIATGLNPGGHGMFDFVHRNPENYSTYVSLLPTKSGLSGTRFVPPHTAQTIFDVVSQKGYPATSLWWPATFPARLETPTNTLPGLGAPDILGRLGVGTLFTRNSYLIKEELKTNIELLTQVSGDKYTGILKGPIQKKRKGLQEIGLDLQIEITGEETARLFISNQVIDLTHGVWSPILELSFKVGLFFKIHAITRVILTQTKSDVRLYMLPLQIHPLHSVWPYATSRGFIKQTWKNRGPFLTLGWPQDTTGLEEGFISDKQFLNLCEAIQHSREQVIGYHIEHFRDGVLAGVFDSLDRVQHMFLRDNPAVIDNWYVKLDSLVERLDQVSKQNNDGKSHMVIVSDHGFTNFDYKVNLNRWLIDKGYLKPNLSNILAGDLKQVDWSQSSAYSIGLNSLYLNLANREGKGSVEAAQVESLLAEMQQELTSWRGPDGRPVIKNVYTKFDSLEGPLVEYGPDFLIGFSSGYRASSENGLGAWGKDSIEPNRDHWGADHCVDPEVVPGVIFSNRGLSNFSKPSYYDFPEITVGEKPGGNGSSSPPVFSDEDSEIVEERLKSLGYL